MWLGAFFRSMISEKRSKNGRNQIFFVSKNQFCHARQPCKRIFEICIVFSHFSARAWNGPQYSNFGNKCPKLGPGTPEDMLFTNLSVAAWFPGNEIALVCTCILGILLPAANTSAFYSRRYICIYYHYFHAWHHVSCVCVCFCPLCDL